MRGNWIWEDKRSKDGGNSGVLSNQVGSADVDNQACREDETAYTGEERNVRACTDSQLSCLALVATEAVLVEVALGLLAPLLLRLAAAAGVVPAGAARHLLVGLSHPRPAKTGLALSEGLSAGAWTCPSIRLCIAKSQLPPVPLTLGRHRAPWSCAILREVLAGSLRVGRVGACLRRIAFELTRWRAILTPLDKLSQRIEM